MKFKFLIFSLVSSFLLTACLKPGSGIGFAESPYWHATASYEVKREHFASECRQFGYSDGTVEMDNCVQKQWTASKDRVAARAAAAAEAAKYDTWSYSKSIREGVGNIETCIGCSREERIEKSARNSCERSGGTWMSFSGKCL